MLHDRTVSTGIHGSRPVRLLLISSDDRDLPTIEDLLEGANPSRRYSRWSIVRHTTPERALAELRSRTIPIVLCEDNASQDGWRGLIEALAPMPDPPLLIVTSCLADERLWVEALHRGAWDVLAKPFDRNELTRTLNTAWIHWRDRHRPVSAARTSKWNAPGPDFAGGDSRSEVA